MNRQRFASGLLVAIALVSAGCKQDPEAIKAAALGRGDAFFEKKMYADAALEYRKAAQAAPRSADAHRKLLKAYVEIGDVLGAFREAIVTADLLPTDITAQFDAGVMHLAAGQFEEAISRADKILKLKPTAVQGHLLRGNALAGLTKFDAAVKQLESAIEADPDRALTYADLGRFQYALGQPEKAEQALKQAVALGPKNVDARLALANFYWVGGKRDLAETTVKEALKIEPENPDANRMIAFLFMTLNRGAEAEAPLKLIADKTHDAGARTLLAEYYRATGRTNDAIAVLDALAADPDAFDLARARKAAILYTSGRKAEAYAAVEEILAKDPKSRAGRLEKVSLLTADNRLDEALQLAQALVAAEPFSVGSRFAVGRIQAAKGNITEAQTAYKEVLKIAPKFVPAQVELAKVSLAAQIYKDAIYFADEALASQPQNADANLVKARALMAQGLPGAEKPMEVLVRAFPDSPDVQAQLGLLYIQRREVAAARTAFERALKRDPSHADALNGMVSMDVAEKKLPAARARLDAALAAHKDSPSLLLLSARTYGAAGDNVNAEKELRRVLDVDPANMDAYTYLGRMYAATDRLGDAIAQYEAIAKRQPKSVIAPTQVGVFLEMQNKRQEAAVWYQKALDLDNRSAVAANNLAMYMVDTGGNLDVALQLAQTAKAQMSDRPEVSDTLGWVFYKKGLGNLAVPHFQDSIRGDGKNPIYHYHLGLAYAAAGNPTDARTSLNKALELSANFPGADDARKTLATLKG